MKAFLNPLRPLKIAKSVVSSFGLISFKLPINFYQLALVGLPYDY